MTDKAILIDMGKRGHWEIESKSSPGMIHRLIVNGAGDILCDCWGYKSWRHCYHQIKVMRGEARFIENVDMKTSWGHKLKNGRCERCNLPESAWDLIRMPCPGYDLTNPYPEEKPEDVKLLTDQRPKVELVFF